MHGFARRLRRRREAYSTTITCSYPDSYRPRRPRAPHICTCIHTPNGFSLLGQLSASYLVGSWRACARTGSGTSALSKSMSILCVMAHSSKGAGRASDHLRNAYNGMDPGRKTSGTASSKLRPFERDAASTPKNELDARSSQLGDPAPLSVTSSPILGEFAAAEAAPTSKN